MYRNTIFLLLLILIPELSYCQLKKVRHSNGVVDETYEVNKVGLRDGIYILEYEGRAYIKGQFNDGLKNGLWTYQPDKDFKMLGYYKDGKKDSIWNCYMKGLLYSGQNIRTGEEFSYFPDGKIRTKKVPVDGNYNFVEYSEQGTILKDYTFDSCFRVCKEYNIDGTMIHHVLMKNDLPYEIFRISEEGKDFLYVGDVSGGTGHIMSKRRSFQTGELYLYEEFDLLDSKPEGVYREYFEDGRVRVEGLYENGYMTGLWTKYKKGSRRIEDQYNYNLSDNIIFDSISFNGYSSITNFEFVEEMPAFMGGEPAVSFRKYIASYLNYPEQAMNKGYTGRVIVQFAVNPEGEVTDIKIVKSVNDYLDEEARRVVKCSPPWRPGLQYGTPVKVLFTFPINFVMQ